MKAEDLYRKEFGDTDSVPKESVIRLLKHFAKVLKMEREQVKNCSIPDVGNRYSIEDIEKCVEHWGLCKVEKEYIERFLNGCRIGLCVVALSKNLKLTTTLDGVITQNPCYVPLNLEL